MKIANHFYMLDENNEWYEPIEITIPETITEIGEYQFYHFTTLKRISVTNKIIKISNYAFYGCTSLLTVTFDDNSSLDTIGNSAFSNCSSLTSIIIPSSVRHIGDYTFLNCHSLTSISIPFIGSSVDAKYEESVFGWIFGYKYVSSNDDISTLSSDFVNKKVEADIPNAIWQWSNYRNINPGIAFQKGGLMSYYYYIPSSLTEIIVSNQINVPIAAFNGCENVETIKFTKGVISIGQYAFQNCNATINYS